MTVLAIHRVSRLELSFAPWPWPLAEARRAEIDAHFAEARRARPDLFNGRILLARAPRIDGDRLSASYFETDFASLLAWRDWGFPDAAVFNGFGMGAVRSSDGAFVLGEMGGHTANAGKIYFPAGTPDRNDLRGDVVDIPASVARETEEEVGLAPADYHAADHWDVVMAGQLFAMIRILDVAQPAAALQARLEANLAAQEERELRAIHLVRSLGDLRPAMPDFVRAFLAAQL